jgi:hypothetical protein
VGSRLTRATLGRQDPRTLPADGRRASPDPPSLGGTDTTEPVLSH